MKYFLRSEKHYVSNMNGKLMTKLFHASRPDLNQTFISVSLLISLLLNLGNVISVSSFQFHQS